MPTVFPDLLENEDHDLSPYGPPPRCTECRRASKMRNTFSCLTKIKFVLFKCLLIKIFYNVKYVKSNFMFMSFICCVGFQSSNWRGPWVQLSSRIIFPPPLFWELSKCQVHLGALSTLKVSFVANVAYESGLNLSHPWLHWPHQALEKRAVEACGSHHPRFWDY